MKNSKKQTKTAYSRKQQERRFIFLFTVPGLILFLWFVIIPIFQGLYYSFFSWSGLTTEMDYLGWANYKKLISDEVVRIALINDLKVAVIRIVFTLVLSLSLALLLTQARVWGNGFFRNVLFFPVVLSGVVVCTVWMMMYNHNFGVINRLLGVIGLSDPASGWLGDKHTALLATIPPALWNSIGFYIIIFISAIENIPRELLESAKIDGAGALQRILRVILPLITPQINFCVIYAAITSLNGSYMFVELLTKGGPGNASEVLGTYMKTVGYNYHQFGYATAVSMMILVVTAVMSVVLNKLFRADAYEY